MLRLKGGIFSVIKSYTNWIQLISVKRFVNGILTVLKNRLVPPESPKLTSWLCHLPSFKARVGWQSRGSGILRGALLLHIWQGKRPASNHKWRRHGNFYGTPKWRWGARETIELRSRITEIFVARCHWKWQPRRICLGLVSKFSFWKSISPFALYDVYLGYPGPFESLNMRMFSKHCPKGKRLSRKYLAGNYITYRPFKGTLEDDFPLSQVIYVSSLKGNILRNHVWYF